MNGLANGKIYKNNLYCNFYYNYSKAIGGLIGLMKVKHINREPHPPIVKDDREQLYREAAQFDIENYIDEWFPNQVPLWVDVLEIIIICGFVVIFIIFM